MRGGTRGKRHQTGFSTAGEACKLEAAVFPSPARPFCGPRDPLGGSSSPIACTFITSGAACMLDTAVCAG